MVETGDTILLDIPGRRLELQIDDKVLKQREKTLKEKPERTRPERGYAQLFDQTILQADQGCDFDFLVKK